MSSVKKKRTLIILAIVAVGCLFVFASCGKRYDELTAPKGISVTDEILSWRAVDKAIGYTVSIDGELYDATTNSLDLTPLTLVPKTYEIQIEATGDWVKTIDSPWSEIFEYTPEFFTDFALKSIGNGQLSISAKAGSTASGKLVIPTSANGQAITQVSSFKDCTGITGVVIPDSVTSIVYSAFAGCTNLRYAHFNEYSDITAINAYTFENCTALDQIDLPQSLTQLGGTAFRNCSSLKSIEIPKNTTKIGSGVFVGCSNLDDLKIDADNPIYKSDGGCIIRKIDNALISGMAKSVIPDYVTKIEQLAFSQCDDLTEITVPGNVSVISWGVFGNCHNLKKVILEEGVKALGNPNSLGECEIFHHCTSLTALEIPASVEYIGKGISQACPALESLTVNSANPTYKSDGNCIILKENNTLIAGCKTSVIPEYVKAIGGYAFYGCVGLGTVDLPDGITDIGPYAFSGSTLKEIILPDDLVNIEYYAFYNCPYLRYVAIPKNVKTIGNCAFYQEFSQCVVFLPEGVEYVGGLAFVCCTVYIEGLPETENWAVQEDIYDSAFNWWYSGMIKSFYNCEFVFEGNTPYLKSAVFKKPWQDDASLGSPIPHREGYTFMGWALEENSTDPLFTVNEVEITIGGNTDTYRVSAAAQELLAFIKGDDIRLYAVWQQNV